MSPYELGSVENYRFITSPELAPYADAGADIGSTGLMGTTKVDVYPFIVVGEDAWGQLSLRGSDALDPTYIPPGRASRIFAFARTIRWASAASWAPSSIWLAPC